MAPNPQTFTVDTTGKTASELHDAFCSGIIATGLGLACSVDGHGWPRHAQNPATFNNGPTIRIAHLSDGGVTAISATGLEDQDITQEQSVGFLEAEVPALSPWGLALLAVILILCALSWRAIPKTWSGQVVP